MATRVLPGAYVTLNDLSQFPEGAASLTVGFVLKCNRGDVDKAMKVTSPTDFLTKYTFSGAPSKTDDPTFYSILRVLAQTNAVYVVRAANNPLYGGAVLGASVDYGEISAASASANTITLVGDAAPVAGDRIIVSGTNVIDGVYTVKSVAEKVVTVDDKFKGIDRNFPAHTGDSYAGTKMIKSPVQPLPNKEIAAITATTAGTGNSGYFTFDGDKTSIFTKGVVFEVTGSSTAANNRTFTVYGSATDVDGNDQITKVYVEETVTAVTGDNQGSAYAFGLSQEQVEALAEGTGFESGELLRIVGINPGAYNGQLGFTILSWTDTASQGSLVYENTMQLNVYDMNTGNPLESFTFSLDPSAKTIDGVSLYYDNVVNQASSYIRIYNKANNTTLPNSTYDPSKDTAYPVKGGNGSNGGEVNTNTLIGALEVFADKNLPISVLGNGCSTEAETYDFQNKMLELADTRKDIVAFLNSRKVDEAATLNSQKAQNIVDYKKGTLASTSFYGCMYAPHVNTSDTFNSRQVAIGSDAVAIAGWLNVINSLGYPYAYAGPQNGLVTGVTCDWKIGDESGEAEILNDASVNYVAYDGKVGRYYMQCQNTLQIANSSLRNIGGVLNVLEIKEHLATFFKEFNQLPITNILRRDIMNGVIDYLDPMAGTRFYDYSFQDVTTDADLAQDTLRYLLAISLTRYASRIYCAINVVRPGFDFSLLQSA